VFRRRGGETRASRAICTAASADCTGLRFAQAFGARVELLFEMWTGAIQVVVGKI
jgi:hypothetical protein